MCFTRVTCLPAAAAAAAGKEEGRKEEDNRQQNVSTNRQQIIFHFPLWKVRYSLAHSLQSRVQTQAHRQMRLCKDGNFGQFRPPTSHFGQLSKQWRRDAPVP